jgi:hypothetical protein
MLPCFESMICCTASTVCVTKGFFLPCSGSACRSPVKLMQMDILAKYSATIALLYCSVCCTMLVHAQHESGSATGYITCNDGNFPARGATVELISLGRLLPGASANSSATSQRTTTDFSGSYEFWSVDPGTYIVNAKFDGYGDDLRLVWSVLDHYSADDRKKLLASFPQVTIKSASSARQDLVLRRAASISGHVSVDLGGTAGTRQVTASLVSSGLDGTISNDSKAASPSYSQSALTDDRGYYRIAGLPPGKYRVSITLTQAYFGVKPGGGANVVLEPQRPGVFKLTVFAPDALEEAAAKTVEVKDGDEITGADITVPARLLHSIGGSLTQGGTPIGGIDVSVHRRDGSVLGSDSISMPDGSYRFDMLPPGTYTIQAKPMGSSSLASSGPDVRPVWGQVVIRLNDTDVLDVNLDIRLRPDGKE